MVEDVEFNGIRWQTPIAVISPHLDDAVLSVGNLLERVKPSSVITVFAGNPGQQTDIRQWDRDCGFKEGDDVMAIRRAEDAAALELLGSASIWLDFLDTQYESARPEVAIVGAAIVEKVVNVRARTVIVPLGLAHDDHKLVAAACIYAMKSMPKLDWYAYTDLPYAYMRRAPLLIFQIKSSLKRLGILSQIYSGGRATTSKISAINCYSTQCVGLGELLVRRAQRPECYWALT
jgi:LmbE family N-acetylglucosaminyl deacetylase